MRARRSGARALIGVAGALVACALAFAGCSSNGPASSSTTTSSSSATTTTAIGSTGSTGSGSSTSSTAASGGPQNLAASASVKQALQTAYVAHNGLPADEIAGTAPNSVYYAYVPDNKTYWALAGFVPTKNASYNTEVAMQDQGCCGVFSMPAGGTWTYMAGYLGVPCPGQIPAALETLWHLATPPDCAVASPTSTTTTS
jgi:hypothetical protein